MQMKFHHPYTVAENYEVTHKLCPYQCKNAYSWQIFLCDVTILGSMLLNCKAHREVLVLSGS